MPTYAYEAAEKEKGCAACREGFDVVHGMQEAGPRECPRCGAPVRRQFSAPGIIGRYSEKTTLSDANLKRHGFKKIRNEGNGKFRVT
jgi:putative FmdB family regulatory protein